MAKEKVIKELKLDDSDVMRPIVYLLMSRSNEEKRQSMRRVIEAAEKIKDE